MICVANPSLITIPKPPPPPPKAPAPRKCAICFNIWPAYGNLHPITALPCGSYACWSCLDKWIDTQVVSGSLHINCMSKNCQHELPVSLSHRRETQTLHDLHLLHETLSKLPEFVWCPRCPSGGLIPSDTACGGVICNSCSYKFCLKCSNPAHGAAPCGANFELSVADKQRMQDERNTLAWKSVNTRECPQCHTCIERNDGCSHMTCSRCKHQFCWLCLQKYKGRHVANNISKCTC